MLPRPEIAQATVRAQSWDGEPKDISNLREGDLVDVTLQLDSPDWRDMYVTPYVVGASPVLESIEHMAPWEGTRDTYHFALRATGKLGTVTPKAVLAFSGTDEDTEYEFMASCTMDLAQFEDQCHVASEHAMLAFHRMAEILTAEGAAYFKAYKQFETVLETPPDDSLAETLLLAALTLLAGAGGSTVGSLLKGGSKEIGRVAFADSMKDLVKFSIKKGAGDLGSEPPSLEGGPAEPFQWYMHMSGQLHGQMQFVQEVIDSWRRSVRAHRMLADFDPAVVIQTHLQFDGAPMTTRPMPDVAQLERSFELAIWQAWLTDYGYVLARSPVYVPQTGRGALTVQQNFNDAVIERLDALGVDGAAWVVRFSGHAKAAVEKTLKKRSLEEYENNR
jgi:hypothetical protein